MEKEERVHREAKKANIEGGLREHRNVGQIGETDRDSCYEGARKCSKCKKNVIQEAIMFRI